MSGRTPTNSGETGPPVFGRADAEGATPGESERYDLAGSYPTLVDGLMRHISRRRQSE